MSASVRLHHVQVSCPPGGEDASRTFYGTALGLTEVAKPEPLRGRGGAWFRAVDAGGVVTAEIHVGVEADFTPARKAHPALMLDDEAFLDSTVARLRSGGHPVNEAERTTFPGFVRVHTADPHGNRVELLAPA